MKHKMALASAVVAVGLWPAWSALASSNHAARPSDQGTARVYMVKIYGTGTLFRKGQTATCVVAERVLASGQEGDGIAVDCRWTPRGT
jgi:hypothetical protein